MALLVFVGVHQQSHSDPTAPTKVGPGFPLSMAGSQKKSPLRLSASAVKKIPLTLKSKSLKRGPHFKIPMKIQRLFQIFYPRVPTNIPTTLSEQQTVLSCALSSVPEHTALAVEYSTSSSPKIKPFCLVLYCHRAALSWSTVTGRLLRALEVARRADHIVLKLDLGIFCRQLGIAVKCTLLNRLVRF